MKAILDLIGRHKRGEAVGMYSVCSAHPLVIEASMRHTLNVGGFALIEATSNQVNQDGGYTGMLPQDFAKRVYTIADKVGLAHDQVILGGDHLGPNCWQKLDASVAMEKSKVLIQQYVLAGFKKIHLDCSMSCLGDPVPLCDGIVAERAATLCLEAEIAWKALGGEAPVYVIGTEVPVPGGATEDLGELMPTLAEAADITLDIHKQAFADKGLGEVWARVIGLVVQPGVEFDHHKVIDYVPEKAKSLVDYVGKHDHIVYEAHSTDYQTPENLSQLVVDHFAILKVGPGLTFAMREAFWALDKIEREWLGDEKASQLKDTLLSAMRDNPGYWNTYYKTDSADLKLDCQYSFSDRIRYYWPQPSVEKSVDVMIANFREASVPLTLLSQNLPSQYGAIRQKALVAQVEDVVMHHITGVLKHYSDACNLR